MYVNIILSCDGHHKQRTGWVHSPRKRQSGDADMLLTTPQDQQPTSVKSLSGDANMLLRTPQVEQAASVAQDEQSASVPQIEQPGRESRRKDLRSNTRSKETKKNVTFSTEKSPKSPRTSPNSAPVKPTKLVFDDVGQAAKSKKPDQKKTSAKKKEIKEASEKKEKRPRPDGTAAFQKRIKQAEQALEKKFEKKMDSKVKELKILMENQAPPAREPVSSFYILHYYLYCM